MCAVAVALRRALLAASILALRAAAFVPGGTANVPHVQVPPAVSRAPVMAAAPAGGDGSSRRAFLGAAGLAVASQVLGAPPEAAAFDNRVVPKPKFLPTMPGSQPEGVGEGPKDGKLTACKGEPNCFTSSPKGEDPKHFYPPFEYEGVSKEQAMADIMEVINGYKPGQGDIDQGGFKVVTARPDYVYVQYESGKFGFIDDFEAAAVEDGKVLVRSAARQGEKDFGVNAMRINYIASQLNQKKGWKCSEITKSTHPDYYK
mmetsp:Transcript_78650/g.222469  ORF Transcript_78650/g.222469 Transcript_78650/m.222469 type:complete len:259 (-) Transcript_78650:66-842(-)